MTLGAPLTFRSHGKLGASARSEHHIGDVPHLDMGPDDLPEGFVSMKDADAVADPLLYGLVDGVDRQIQQVRYLGLQIEHSHKKSPALVRNARDGTTRVPFLSREEFSDVSLTSGSLAKICPVCAASLQVVSCADSEPHCATAPPVRSTELCAVGGVSWGPNQQHGGGDRPASNGEHLFPTVHHKTATPSRLRPARSGLARRPQSLPTARTSLSAAPNSGYPEIVTRRSTPSWSSWTNCDRASGRELFSSLATADGKVSAVAGAPPNPVRPDDGLHAGKIAPVTNPALVDKISYGDRRAA